MNESSPAESKLHYVNVTDHIPTTESKDNGYNLKSYPVAIKKSSKQLINSTNRQVSFVSHDSSKMKFPTSVMEQTRSVYNISNSNPIHHENPIVLKNDINFERVRSAHNLPFLNHSSFKRLESRMLVTQSPSKRDKIGSPLHQIKKICKATT